MITSKQRAYLRGLANTLDPILHVGKDGLNDNLLKQADDALTARELIKGTVLQNCPISAREALDEIAAAVGAEPVQTVGKRFVLYRANPDEPEIVLPE
ncbi:MAG: ribosome assembly RNA-binding protein YhbY [Clostridia bacterium]|nr:ribosome assembly RNA-binding protein YhbY [Clostridia bacterium]